MNARRAVVYLLSVFALAVFLFLPAAHAGPFDGVKKKAAGKIEKKAQDATKKAGDVVPGGPGADSVLTPGTSEGGAAPAGSAAPPQKVSAVSTKFDFVPGDKVILADDFTQDELGEFPAQWKLVEGTFEVAEMNGERWLRCMSDRGHIRMKLPEAASLPEFWTLEFDFYCDGPAGNVLVVSALAAGDQTVWEATFPYSGQKLRMQTGTVTSETPLEGTAIWGTRHHVMFQARGASLKAYMDRERLANVPEIATAGGPPNVLDIFLGAPTHPLITGVRYAEGPKPPQDLLAAGKLVSYGIYFATGSDVVLPESAPVLRQVAAYLKANAAVKLRITGHTDNVGSAAANLDLSQRRAASVSKVLTQEFEVPAERLATDGKGDTEPVADNAKSEGRAMNRRVEFAKL
jgi:OOP family OmpA-OmpF porin